MRMSEQLQVLNFSLHPTSHVPADELLPRDDLQSDLLVGDSMHGQLDLSKRTLAESPNDMICTDSLLCLLLRQRQHGSSVLVAI